MPPRGPIAQYDPKEDVIFVDATGIDAQTIEDVDAIFEELEAITAQYPDRYVIACWKGVQVGSQAIVSHYGRRTIAWQRNVRVVVRYAADDPVVRSYIRSEAVKHQREGMRSNLFDDRESALAAVRAMKAVDARRR